MFPLSKTKKIFIASLVIGLVAVGVYVVLYIVLGNMSAEVSRLNTQSTQQLEQNEQQAATRRIIEDTVNLRNTLDSFFVSSDGVAGFITTIESLATDAQVDLEITTVNVEENETINNEEGNNDNNNSNTTAEIFQALQLDMTAQGNWSQVTHFVTLLESLPKKVSIQEVSFEETANPEGQAEPQWNALVTLTASKFR